MKETKNAFIKRIINESIRKTNRISFSLKQNLDKDALSARLLAEKLVLENLAEQMYYLQNRVDDLMKDLIEAQK